MERWCVSLFRVEVVLTFDSISFFPVTSHLVPIENFLMNGPLGDSDWWEKNSNDDGSSAKDDGESTTSEIPQEEGEEVTSNEQPFKGKRFCNRGLQTWSLARQAWIAEGRGSGNELPKAPPIPASFKSELVKCLADRRHFELSQRISLHCLIDSYQEVWNDGASE